MFGCNLDLNTFCDIGILSIYNASCVDFKIVNGADVCIVCTLKFVVC